jgi:hypothetical protein
VDLHVGRELRHGCDQEVLILTGANRPDTCQHEGATTAGADDLEHGGVVRRFESPGRAADAVRHDRQTLAAHAKSREQRPRVDRRHDDAVDEIHHADVGGGLRRRLVDAPAVHRLHDSHGAAARPGKEDRDETRYARVRMNQRWLAAVGKGVNKGSHHRQVRAGVARERRVDELHRDAETLQFLEIGHVVAIARGSRSRQHH